MLSKSFYAMVILISLFSISYAQQVKNKNSTIVEADGYVYLSENKTIREIREEALANAKREALERGPTYIKSISKVENFQ